jgi:enterochelin esterase-like enzyme
MSQFFTTEVADFQGLTLMTVKSTALKRRADLTVFIPKVEIPPAVPVVILLHGVYGSHWAWTAKGKAHQTTQGLIDTGKIKPMIIAMPSDGLFGDGSGYVPHQTENYEKWIVEEVGEVLKEQIEEVRNDSPLFIAGLSMGGFGALRLGAKYPSIFKAFSGLSSITDFTQIEMFVADFNDLKTKALEQDTVLEWLVKNREILPPFRFDCGTEDILIAYNRQLRRDLVEYKIPHTYQEFSGGHTWEYWTEHLEDTLLFFNDCL